MYNNVKFHGLFIYTKLQFMTKKSIVLQKDMASEAYFSRAIFDWSNGTILSIYLSVCALFSLIK